MNFIVETKNEYTIQLVNILTPLIYEGFESIYSETKKIIKKGEEKKMLKTFQQFIRKIPSWNNNLINTETKRIISQSRCDWLHDLLKAVIKANIILLSNSSSISNCSYTVNNEYLEIPLEHFIHKCYIECARQIYTCPYLFFHNVKPIDRKRNQRECLGIINSSIKEAIRKMLPVQHILKMYLGNEIKEDNNEIDRPISLNESENLKNLVSKDLKNFINPEVVENFNSEKKSFKDNTSSDSVNTIKMNDETANLLSEIKKKYNQGSLLEKLNESIVEKQSNIEQNNYLRDTSESIRNSVNRITGGSVNKDSSSPEYNELNKNNSGLDYEESISKDKVKSTNVSEGKHSYKSNKSISNIDEIIDTTKSESYKVAHDSEYEGVFSNINDKYKNIDSEKKERKKRKDEYFSKYNNI